MRLLLAFPVLALSLAACGDDGPRTTQNRDVAAFTKLVNDDSVDVRVHVGAPPRIQVRAGENVIGDVRTQVVDGTLRVTVERTWGGGDVEVEAWTPSLHAITANGSGDVEADGIAADALTVDTGGSGDIRAGGRAQRLELTSMGSGDVQLATLDAAAARVRIGGSGDADVRAEQRLDVTVAGSGDVRYHGEPQLTQSDDGSGNVERAG